MAKLDINRMSNSTKLSRVDNAHVDLEADLETILGVPDNTPITIPVLGKTVDGSPPVQTDGSLKGVMRFYEGSVTSDVNAAAGFEFTDQTVTKRLVLVSSGLKIYKLDGTTWTPVADLENPGSGSGLLSALADVDPSLAPNAGDLLAWDNVNGWWEAVAPASGSGRTRFADLDDTPPAAGAAPADPFNTADVGKLVGIVSEASLGFVTPPAGIGAPFCMLMNAGTTGDGAGHWAGGGKWTDVFVWAFNTYTDDGGFLTDDTSLLTNDGSDANKFITLTSGLYQISFWYVATGGQTKWGTRQWRVAGSNSDGPATLGIQQEANLFWQSKDIPNDEQPTLLPGIHYLSTAMLIQYADGTIKFEVAQDSKNPMTGVTFYAAITKVK
jgi:hypothetical protein